MSSNLILLNKCVIKKLNTIKMVLILSMSNKFEKYRITISKKVDMNVIQK